MGGQVLHDQKLHGLKLIKKQEIIIIVFLIQKRQDLEPVEASVVFLPMGADKIKINST